MSRYIDESALLSAIKKEYFMLKHIRKTIANTPSIDIVRCKECKYWIGHLTDDDSFDEEDECRWRDSETPNADDFCSYGERKSDE